MLAALNDSGVVQLNGHGVTRWMSLSEGLVSETTAESSVLLDVNKKIVLRRETNGNVIERRSVQIDAGRASESVLLAFLAGPSGGAFSEEFIQFSHIGKESWKQITVDGASRIQLSVQIDVAGTYTDLEILVDPDSHLPVAGNFGSEAASSSHADDGVTFAKLSYADDSAAQRVAAAFPEDIPIADTAQSNEVKTAALNDVASNPVEAVAAVTDAPAEIDKSPHDATPLFGAASKWKAVEIQTSKSGDVVEDLDVLMAKLLEQNSVQPVVPADARLSATANLSAIKRIPAG